MPRHVSSQTRLICSNLLEEVSISCVLHPDFLREKNVDGNLSALGTYQSHHFPLLTTFASLAMRLVQNLHSKNGLR